MTSLIRYTLRAAAVYDPDPGTVLSSLNDALREEYERDHGHFRTAIFGVLTPDGDGFRLTRTSGGHPLPLLIGADGTTHYPPVPVGPLIGVLDDAAFTATVVRLEPGDTLVLYTDGLTEARTGPGRDRFEDEGLRAFAASIAPAAAAAAVSAIIALLDGLDDDIAILALGVPTSPVGSAPPGQGDRHEPGAD